MIESLVYDGEQENINISSVISQSGDVEYTIVVNIGNAAIGFTVKWFESMGAMVASHVFDFRVDGQVYQKRYMDIVKCLTNMTLLEIARLAIAREIECKT